MRGMMLTGIQVFGCTLLYCRRKLPAQHSGVETQGRHGPINVSRSGLLRSRRRPWHTFKTCQTRRNTGQYSTRICTRCRPDVHSSGHVVSQFQSRRLQRPCRLCVRVDRNMLSASIRLAYVDAKYLHGRKVSSYYWIRTHRLLRRHVART